MEINAKKNANIKDITPNANFMITKSIISILKTIILEFDFKEVQRFGTEYLSIQQYIKYFMNNVMKKAKLYSQHLLKVKKETQNLYDGLVKYLDYLKVQKASLINKILTDKN